MIDLIGNILKLALCAAALVGIWLFLSEGLPRILKAANILQGEAKGSYWQYLVGAVVLIGSVVVIVGGLMWLFSEIPG